MTNEEVIKTLEANYPDACFEQLREAVDAAIEALKAQDADSDTISRKAAIDAILAVTGNSSVRELYEHVQEHGLSEMWSGGVNAAIDIIIAVPSAQPEKHDKRTETHSCDCISRQQAIDALMEILDRPKHAEPHSQNRPIVGISTVGVTTARNMTKKSIPAHDSTELSNRRLTRYTHTLRRKQRQGFTMRLCGVRIVDITIHTTINVKYGTTVLYFRGFAMKQ